MPPHAASFQSGQGVVEHAGIAAQHDMGRFRRQHQAGRLLQCAAFDTRGNPLVQAVGAVLAGRERNEAELRRMALPQFLDGVRVAQVVRGAYRMAQHHRFEAGPGRGGFQDGKKRTDGAPRGEKPEMTGVWNFVQGEESIRRGGDPESLTGPKLRETRRQRTVLDDVEMDLVRPLVGRVDHGIRAPDAFAIDVHPCANELTRSEGGQLGFKAQRNQPPVPVHTFDYACFHPFAHRRLLSGRVADIWGTRSRVQPSGRQGIGPHAHRSQKLRLARHPTERFICAHRHIHPAHFVLW